MAHNSNNNQNELGRSGAGRTLSHCDASRAANAHASDSSPATLEDELILEEQRRAALKRMLTQPDYPSRKNLAIYGPGNARLDSSTSTGPAAIHNSQQPIDRLPNEILGAIFLVCGDPSPASAFPRDGTMHQLPMDPHQVVPYSRAAVLLGRVCLRWYSITRGLPMLWTHVDVAYPGKEALSVLKLCLRYSAGLPLTLWISDRMRSTARQYSIHPRFTSLVAENAHRWREISIELYDELDVLDPLVALPLGAFTSLRRARLNFADLGALEDDLDTLLWRQFFSSPRLDCVDLVSMEYIRAGLDVAPLRQLTSLGLHFAEPAIVSTLLAACTDLELLYIRIERSRFDREENQRLSLPSTYHLPRLRILILCGPIDWDPLFSSLTAPALDRLDMNRITIPHRAIEGMLARSSARIRMITVHHPALGVADGMISLLQSQTLQSLRVLRYRNRYRGSSREGWEDAFDVQPHVPSHVLLTKNACEAERSYRELCEGTLSTRNT